MSRFLLFSAVLSVCCGYALTRGGAAERVGAAIFVLAAPLTWVLLSPFPDRFQHVEARALLVDCTVFLAFFTLSLFTRRFWPLWMTGMQGVGVISHLGILLAPDVIPRIYGNAVQLWSYPMLFLLVAATWRHRRRLTMHGADSSWARSSSPSSAGKPMA